ncbi:unnamed protein product, partial [Eretmochelys imbricata]
MSDQRFWEKEFKAEDTKEMPFRLNQQVSKSVQMMHQNGPFAFASIEEEKVKILELPYANREMSMIILLPNVVSGLDE